MYTAIYRETYPTLAIGYEIYTAIYRETYHTLAIGYEIYTAIYRVHEAAVPSADFRYGRHSVAVGCFFCLQY